MITVKFGTQINDGDGGNLASVLDQADGLSFDSISGTPSDSEVELQSDGGAIVTLKNSAGGLLFDVLPDDLLGSFITEFDVNAADTTFLYSIQVPDGTNVGAEFMDPVDVTYQALLASNNVRVIGSGSDDTLHGGSGAN